MFRQSYSTLKQFLQYKSKPSFRKDFKLKSLAIPSVLVGSYFFIKSQFSFSNSRLHLASTRRLSLQSCIDLQEGEMREVKYGTKDNESVLVVKYNGQLRALSNYCPHFGAPLHTGVMVDNIVKCPWHGASFDVLTGETDISPSINNLPVYEVLSDSEGVYINLPESVTHSATPKMSKRDPQDTRKFLIIGGGPAGLSAAETLRQSGYTGEITILSKDKYIPYDRSILSKFFPASAAKIYLRTPEFLKEYDIDIKTEVSVTSIDNSGRKVKLQDGTDYSYDKLLVASGGSPMIPKIKGVDRPHVYTFRSFEDLERLKEACKTAKNIVIVGGSFIGMESASALKKAFPELNVTVVEMSQTPFYQSLGKDIGAALQTMHEEKGIKFLTQNHVTEIKPDSVLIKSNEEVQADVVLLGVGITPNTKFINDSLAMSKSFVKTDKYLTTSDENIFAAGDMAAVPYGEEYLAFGHYVNAQQQGAVAALNMLNQKVTYDYVPYFWSRQWDKTIQYTGHAATWDEVFIDGDLQELKFAAYYLRDGKVVGFASMNIPNAANIMYEAFRNGKVPRASMIKDGSANLTTIKKSLQNVKVKCKRADCVCERRRAAKEQANKENKL